MPKTLLFETNLHIDIDDDTLDDDNIVVRDIIVPGMIFKMNYTQTKKYMIDKDSTSEYISDEASTTVTVVSIRNIIEGCCNSGIHIMDCVLQTDTPIFICAIYASLGRKFILYRDNTLIASGSVHNFLDECHEKWKYAIE